MTEQSDPARLKTLEASTPELKRALDALGKSELDAARLARVAKALGPLLDAPPPAHGVLVKTALRFVQGKLVALRIGLATLVIGTTAYWWTRHHDAPSPTPVEQTRETMRAPAPAPVVEAVPRAEVAAQETVTPDTSVDAPTLAPVETKVPARTHRTHRRSHANASSSAASVSTEAATEASAQDVRADTEVEAKREPKNVVPEPEPEEEPKRPAARKASEVQLLQQARKVVDDDPREALGLLAEHAARFPNGMLAPEREVLAIEALRKLGDTHAADKRLRAFRARYPDSLHLRRLERRSE